MLKEHDFGFAKTDKLTVPKPRSKTPPFQRSMRRFNIFVYESWCPMKLVNIGFGNMVNADRVVAMIAPDSAPVKRVVQDAREKGMLVDASYGRKTQAVVIMDSGHVVLSGIPLDTVTGRIAEEPDE